MFKDDQAHLRTGHGPKTMAIIKPMALDLLRQAVPTSLKSCGKRAG